MPTSDFEASVARLTRRVDAALAQSERFDRLADEVADWSRRWSEQSIARWLNDEEATVSQAERALVALALKGTSCAGEHLREYDAELRGRSHDLLWQVALIEWERRNESDVYESAV